MLFEDAVAAYWDDKSRRLRGNTLEGYANALTTAPNDAAMTT